MKIFTDIQFGHFKCVNGTSTNVGRTNVGRYKRRKVQTSDGTNVGMVQMSESTNVGKYKRRNGTNVGRVHTSEGYKHWKGTNVREGSKKDVQLLDKIWLKFS